MNLPFETYVKLFAVAFAVGLDVLAISIGVGVAQLPMAARIRLGSAFAAAEIIMQLIGYELGSGAGRMFGTVAEYVGFALLAVVGLYMIREAYRAEGEASGFDPTRGAGLITTALSISLDSLGVGFALPGVDIPLIPILITVSITTSTFTFVGLEFGSRLGQRYERRAEIAAGTILVALGILFTIQHAIATAK